MNRPIDAEAAEEMHKLFLEVIAAPAFDEAALTKFATKKNLRLVQVAAADQNGSQKMSPAACSSQDADIRPCKTPT